MMEQLRLPFEPLEEALTARGEPLKNVLSGATISRYRVHGVPFWTADRLAVTKVGMHPAWIWGREYWRAAERGNAQWRHRLVERAVR